MTSDNAGPDFKYESDYETLGELIRRFVPAWKVEMEKYFSLVVFNYLFNNGDAHLKNFALLESPGGDHVLSPAYDLINTRLHVDDSALALKRGLFKGDFETDSFVKNGFYAYDDFYEFGVKLEISPDRTRKILSQFCQEQVKVGTLVSRSFLDESMKKQYMDLYLDRLRALNYSYLGKV